MVAGIVKTSAIALGFCSILTLEAMADSRLRIFNTLSPRAFVENVTVTIGNETHVIRVNRSNPRSSAEFVCQDGNTVYSLSSETLVVSSAGAPMVKTITGQGTLACSGNGNLEVAEDDSVSGRSNLYLVTAKTDGAEPQTPRPMNCRLKRIVTPNRFNGVGNWSTKYVCE